MLALRGFVKLAYPAQVIILKSFSSENAIAWAISNVNVTTKLAIYYVIILTAHWTRRVSLLRRKLVLYNK